LVAAVRVAQQELKQTELAEVTRCFLATLLLVVAAGQDQMSTELLVVQAVVVLTSLETAALVTLQAQTQVRAITVVAMHREHFALVRVAAVLGR